MSKVIYVCFKDPLRCNSEMEDKIGSIARQITPDNIVPQPTRISRNKKLIYGIVNPTNTIAEESNGVFLGTPYGEHDHWWEPGNIIPDGSFSIFRSDEFRTEVITDVVGSRTIWYYHDSELFIASSSQRAIIMILGSFNFNSDVIPWMLSTGALGPGFSWDSRIKMLPPNSSISVDYNSWSVSLKTNAIDFKAISISDTNHEDNLRNSLRKTFSSLNISLGKWVLPLSGGYDSRSILVLFNSIGQNLKKLGLVTWGLKRAIKEPGNDAYVAKKVADYFKVEHKYYHTDISTEPVSAIFNRYLVCGEGRIDHVSGYMDGFRIWKTLFEDDVQGIIRGDEGFGWVGVDSALDVRLKVGIATCEDFSNLSYFQTSDKSNKIPQFLEIKDGETLETWRDRLYHEYRIPVILAALSDLKLSYIEVINPLLSREIIKQVRIMPDHLREDKTLFKKVVNSISPAINYATSGANANASSILKSKSVVEMLRSELSTEICKGILPQEFIAYILKNLVVAENRVNWKQKLKSILKLYLPKRIINRLSAFNSRDTIGINVLAFRSYIICRMTDMLNQDAIRFNASQVTSIND